MNTALIVERHPDIEDVSERFLREGELRQHIDRLQDTEKALRRQERQFRSLVEANQDLVMVLEDNGDIRYLSPSVVRLLGNQPEVHIARRLPVLIHPQDRLAVINIFREVRHAVNLSQTIEFRLRGQEGDWWMIEATFQNLAGHVEDAGIAVYGRDITARWQAEEKIKELNVLLRAIKEINEALLRVKSEPDLFQQTCDLLMQAPNIRFTWIGLMQPESFEIKPVAWAGYEAGYLSGIRVTWDDSPHGGGAIGNAIRTGQPGVIEDIAGDPRALPWREAALKRGYSYMLALPLIHEDQTMGTLNVYSEKQKVFREDEIEFLQQVAGDIAVGIKSLRLAQGLEHSVKQLQAMMRQTVEAIAFLAEMRDPYTAGHQQKVTRLALALAGELGLDEACCEGLRVAGLLHDIGKIAVPAELLSKPGKLSEYEFSLIKAHSQAGHDILKKIEFPWPVAQMVLQHHERLDGSGYPQGLAGQDILPEARILAVADVVEAMASHRPYRPALGIDKALEEITRNRGILYDPEVVDACIMAMHRKNFPLK